MREFGWSDVWNYCRQANQPERYGTFASAENLILSLPAEEQIKALEDAPEEFIIRVKPYLKELKPQESVLPEDWEAAKARWNELKEIK